MCFDRSGGHAPPSARHLFPDSAERSVRLFRFSFRLGQRGIAPLCARPLYEPRRQVEPADGHLLHAVGVQQRRRVVAEHRPEGAGGRREAERAARLGVHVRHGERQVGRREPVEPEAGALGQQLPYLDVVALAGALLVAAPGVAVEQPRLAGPLAEERRDRVLVGELGAVVGEHGAEDPPHAVGAEDRPDALQGGRDARGGLLRERQRELEPAGAVQQREQAGGVLPGPLDGVHLPGRGARVLPEGEERGMRPAGGVAGGRPAGGALPRPVADLSPELHVGHAVVARRDPAVDGRGRQVHRPAVAGRHLLGGQPPAQAVPDGLQPRRRGRLVGVDPAPGRDEHFSRFPSAPSFASWCGLAPSERSSGETESRGGITRAGNGHVRRALVEASWHVPMSTRHPKRPRPGHGAAPAVSRHAAKCNRRLQERREAMSAAGKRPCVANCATAREMACWVWAIAGMAS